MILALALERRKFKLEVEQLMVSKIDSVWKEYVLNGVNNCLEPEYYTFLNKVYEMETDLHIALINFFFQ